MQDIERNSKEYYKNNIEFGIAKELSRISLPVGVYTDWVWKMDLHNLFHFLGLRLDPHAQYEVRVYAEAMWTVLKDAYPMCCKAFEEYRLFAKSFSKTEIGFLQVMLNHFKSDYPETASNIPEFKQLLEKAGVVF